MRTWPGLRLAMALWLLSNAGNLLAQTSGVSVPLELKRGHLVIPAKVGATNTVWLMLDTGFSITVIDPKLVDLMDLKAIGKTTIAGIAGEERADLFAGPTFDFAGATYTPRRVAALPSERNRRSRRLEGVLGAGFFRRFVVSIDPKAAMVQLHEPDEFRYTGPGEVLPLKIRGSTPVVEATIVLSDQTSIRGEFEIDLGCDGALCLGHDFVESHKLLDAGGAVHSGGRSGVGGDAQTKVGYLPALKLGELTVEKPETNFFLQGSPVDRGHAGHIGFQALRTFKITLNYSRQQLILEPY